MLTLDLTNIDLVTMKQYIKDFLIAMWYFHILDHKDSYSILGKNATYRLSYSSDDMYFDSMRVELEDDEMFDRLVYMLGDKSYTVELMG